jgi:hypothetical protein
MILADTDVIDAIKTSIEESFGDSVLAAAIGASGDRQLVTAVFANTRNT